MIVKLFFIIVLIVTLGGVSIFATPDLTRSIEQSLGFSGFTDSVRGSKESFDTIVTDIPSSNEVLGTYESALSGARDAANTVTEGTKTVKQQIDEIRGAAQEAEESFNKAKEQFNTARETLSGATKTMQEVGETISELSDTFNGSGNSLE